LPADFLVYAAVDVVVADLFFSLPVFGFFFFAKFSNAIRVTICDVDKAGCNTDTVGSSNRVTLFCGLFFDFFFSRFSNAIRFKTLDVDSVIGDDGGGAVVVGFPLNDDTLATTFFFVVLTAFPGTALFVPFRELGIGIDEETEWWDIGDREESKGIG